MADDKHNPQLSLSLSISRHVEPIFPIPRLARATKGGKERRGA